jgi:hypothetical protein
MASEPICQDARWPARKWQAANNLLFRPGEGGESMSNPSYVRPPAEERTKPPFAQELHKEHGDNGDSLPEERKIRIEVLSPSQIIAYEVPPGTVLIGDNHITRGSATVIGGAPGVGKSRASVAMAEAGATKLDWFGLKVHTTFRTLIIQNENGRFRLKQEFAELDANALDPFVRITPPPPFGITFDNQDFCDQLSEIIGEFDPGVVIIDPWNAASRDEKARNYQDTFKLIRQVIPAGDNAPAIVIVAHTRKPQGEDRVSGRALLNLLAGSYVLGSVPRTVFVMQAASDDITDERVVWTCCKNNDGELGNRSAWKRCNGLFQPVHDFDWEGFDRPNKNDGLSWENVPDIIADLNGQSTKKAIVKELQNRGASQPSAYRYVETAEKKGSIRLNKKTRIYEVKL